MIGKTGVPLRKPSDIWRSIARVSEPLRDLIVSEMMFLFQSSVFPAAHCATSGTSSAARCIAFGAPNARTRQSSGRIAAPISDTELHTAFSPNKRSLRSEWGSYFVCIELPLPIRICRRQGT